VIKSLGVNAQYISSTWEKDRCKRFIIFADYYIKVKLICLVLLDKIEF